LKPLDVGGCSFNGTPPCEDPALLGGIPALPGGPPGGGGGSLKGPEVRSIGFVWAPDGYAAPVRSIGLSVEAPARVVFRVGTLRVGDPRLVPRPDGAAGGGEKALLPWNVPCQPFALKPVWMFSALLLRGWPLFPSSTLEKENLLRAGLAS
jgi:hypothetical protein